MSQRSFCGFIFIALFASLACGLTEKEIAQLVIVERQELGRLLPDRVAFLPRGEALIGGWLEWPQAPVVLWAPNPPPLMQIGLQAASPRFAISPSGKRIAMWKRIGSGPEERAELTIIHLESQTTTKMGEPVPITPAMQLLWLSEERLVYATEEAQRPVGLLYLADLAGSKPKRLLELHEGQWQDLRPGAEPGEIYAVWGGNPPVTYAISCEGPPALPRVVSPQIFAPDKSQRTIEIDASGTLIVGLSATEGIIVDRGVRAAAWRPDGQAILYVKDKHIFVASATAKRQEPRLLADMQQLDEAVYLRGCTWAPEGNYIAFWGVAGASGKAWRASLGLERIIGRFLFPEEAPVQADCRLWIVSQYQREAMGNIIEPVWSTLKAQFTVTRVLHTAAGILAEAQSTGGQPGVVERIAAGPKAGDPGPGHIAIGVGGQTAASWTRTHMLHFRPGLTAWLEKTKYIGQPESLFVERMLLPPLTVTGAVAPQP